MKNQLIPAKMSKVVAQNVKIHDHDWKELSSRVSVFISETWNQRHSSMCSYYIDTNGKEWIVILLPPAPPAHNLGRFNSYLYDVENDKFCAFIKNYHQDINIKFNISHSVLGPNARGQSFVIDNDNHILYWLESSRSQISFLTLDIKNLKDIKFIDQTFLRSPIDDVIFCKVDYTMLFVGDTIQFVLGQDKSESGNSVTNFQYDIETKRTSAVHENIHLKSIDHVAKIKTIKLDDLKVGGYIDVKDRLGYWHLAIILDIKDKQFYDKNDDDTCNIIDKNKCCSMKIFVHYVDWPKKWDEWVYVTSNANVYTKVQLDELKNVLKPMEDDLGDNVYDPDKIDSDDIIDQLGNGTSICNCVNQECIHNDITSKLKKFHPSTAKQFNRCHKIALPKTQSLYTRSLHGLHGLYSKNTKTMIMVGQNGERIKDLSFGGIYLKRMSYNHDKKYFETIVNGFLKKELNKQLYIPQDICQLILKYYFIPNDKEWKYMTKRDENDMVIHSNNDDTFHSSSRYVIVDSYNKNDNYNHQATSLKDDSQHITVYEFGRYLDGTEYDTISRLDINTQTYSYKIRRLTSIKCPKSNDDNRYWHVVFCQKSQTIHLFEREFTKHYSIKLEQLQNAKTTAS